MVGTAYLNTGQAMTANLAKTSMLAATSNPDDHYRVSGFVLWPIPDGRAGHSDDRSTQRRDVRG